MERLISKINKYLEKYKRNRVIKSISTIGTHWKYLPSYHTSIGEYTEREKEELITIACNNNQIKVINLTEKVVHNLNLAIFKSTDGLIDHFEMRKVEIIEHLSNTQIESMRILYG